MGAAGKAEVNARVLALPLMVAVLAGPGCARAQARAPGPVDSALLAVAADFDAAPGALPGAWAQLEALADRVTARHRRSGANEIDDLRAVLFQEEKFQREIDSDDPRFFVLPSVLAAHRGSCLGLGALMLALGERLGLPLDGVMVPGHFFVRTREAPARNIELLRAGEVMPDAWYHAKYGPWPAQDSAYFRPLGPSELLGLHWFNAGNFLRRQGRLDAAAQAFARAAAEFPAFAEASASLGAVEQSRGALPAAAVAYDRAGQTRADLPGLQQNRALLKQQLSSLPEGTKMTRRDDTRR